MQPQFSPTSHERTKQDLGRKCSALEQSPKNTANLQTGFVGRFEEKSRKIWQKFTRFLSRIRKLIFCSVLHMHPLPSQFLVLTSYLFSTIHMVPTLNVILLLQYNNNFLLSPTSLVPIFWHHMRLPTFNIFFQNESNIGLLFFLLQM